MAVTDFGQSGHHDEEREREVDAELLPTPTGHVDAVVLLSVRSRHRRSGRSMRRRRRVGVERIIGRLLETVSLFGASFHH